MGQLLFPHISGSGVRSNAFLPQMFLVHHFVSYPSKSKSSRAAAALKDKAPSHIPGVPNIDGVVSESTSGTQTPARAPRPPYKAPGTVPRARVRQPLPEGAVVHCVAVSL